MTWLFNYLSSMLENFSTKIAVPNIPWNDYFSYFNTIVTYISQANALFPVSDLLKIMGLIFGVYSVLLLLWSLKFLRSLLPF